MEINGVTVTEKDVINPDAWVPEGQYNPHRVRPWLITNSFSNCGCQVIGIVFATCEGDALDEAVNENRMDHLQLKEEEADDETIRLGNAGEPFDIEGVHIEELPNPKASWLAQYAASQKEG